MFFLIKNLKKKKMTCIKEKKCIISSYVLYVVNNVIINLE